MTEAILVMYGRIETRAEEYFVSSVATAVDLVSLAPSSKGNVVSWENLDDDVIAELMIWENTSVQDLRYLEGLAE